MMKMIKISRMVAVVAIGCCTLFAARPACSFVWPTIDMAELASFVNTITNVNNQVTNTKNQLKNINNLVTAIGDQVSSIKKYAADLKGTIVNIKSSVTNISENVSKVTEDTADIAAKIDEAIDDVTKTEEENANQAEEEVNEKIEDDAAKEETEAVLAEAEAASEALKKSVNETIDKASETVNQAVETSETALDEMLQTVTDEENGVAAEDREKIIQQINNIKEDINTLKNKITETITAVKEKYNAEYDEKISAAYDKYNQAIEDYYAGKIDKAALAQEGENFKSSVASLDVGIDTDVLAELVAEAENISDNISSLQENILNSIGNAGDYSDGSEEAFLLINRSFATGKTYAFNFHSGHNGAFLKAIYAQGSDKTFLLPKEFWCDELEEDKSPDWETITEKMKAIEDDPVSFRACVVKAKIEDPDIYKTSDGKKLYKKYQKNSVYMHISEDYNVANIVSMNKAKQVSAAWGELEPDDDSNKSTIYTLRKTLKNIDNTRNAYSLMGMAEIEAPKIWSQIRRVDAMNRAKEMVRHFEGETHLYLDGNEEFNEATKNNPGTVKNKNLAKDENAAVEGKVVFPNVIMHVCNEYGKPVDGQLASADDVSLPEVEKTDTEKANKIEQKIAKCLFLYAEAASKGTINGKSISDKDTETSRKEWRVRQQAAYNDAAFGNLTLAVINNYKSSLDVLETKNLPSEPKINVVSIQTGLKESTTAKDDYAAGAQINYYTAQQLLSIVDADAQNQQAEIIKDLSTFDYNYFDTVTGES